VLSWAATGQIAANMALKILNGQRPEGISIVKSANVYMFRLASAAALGIQKRATFRRAVVLLYRQPTAWELYKGYIIGSISLILVEALLIFGLLWQRARRRKVEAELVLTYERLRLGRDGRGRRWDGIGTIGRRSGSLVW